MASDLTSQLKYAKQKMPRIAIKVQTVKSSRILNSEPCLPIGPRCNCVTQNNANSTKPIKISGMDHTARSTKNLIPIRSSTRNAGTASGGSYGFLWLMIVAFSNANVQIQPGRVSGSTQVRTVDRALGCNFLFALIVASFHRHSSRT